MHACCLVLMQYSEWKGGKNTSYLKRCLCCVAGLVLMVCLCHFKTFLLRNNLQYSSESKGYLTRHLLADNKENIRVSLYK